MDLNHLTSKGLLNKFKDGKMSYQATVYKVMIASPGDVDSERGIIREVIQAWNNVNSEDKRIVLTPVSWDTHSSPSMEDRAQSVINKQVLKDCDLLVAVFWTRLGTPTGEALSGTVEEIEEHLKAGKPAMIYFSNSPVHLDSVDGDQYSALKVFKSQLEKRGLIESYDNLNDFRNKFYQQLSIKIISDFQTENQTNSTENSIKENLDPKPAIIQNLSKEAKHLLVEASKDNNGTILKLRTMSGLSIQTGKTNFVEQGNSRSEALWKEAIDLLQSETLIADQGFKGEIFQITAFGYRVADILNQTS